MRFRPIIFSLHTVCFKFASGIRVPGLHRVCTGFVQGQPIVDANDVAKLLLALVFVLYGLGYAERERFNARQARLRDSVQDPFRPIIRAIQGYLRAYHVYRAEALTTWTRQVCTGFAPGLTKLGQVWSVRITQTGQFGFAPSLC